MLSSKKLIDGNKTNAYENQYDKLDTKRKMNSLIKYTISNIDSTYKSSLIDRGASGGLARNDVRAIFKDTPPPRLIDVGGIGGHNVTNLEVVTLGSFVTSQKG